MNFSELFIRRPVATTLLTLAVALSGLVAYHLLPVSPLPQTDSLLFRSALVHPSEPPKPWRHPWRLH